MAESPVESSAQSRRTSSRSARKRSKVTRACDACKARKKACTGDIPCRFCIRLGAECTYNVPYHRGAASSPRSSTRPGGNITPISRPHHTRFESGQTLSSPVATRSTPDDQVEAGAQYRGPASAHSFLDRAVRNLDHHPDTRPVISTSEDALASIFSYGDRQAVTIPQSQLTWPDRSTVDFLVRRYFDFASPTYRILHQGTTERWVDVLFGQHVRVAYQGRHASAVPPAAEAIILLQCAIASLSLSAEQNSQHRNLVDWQQCEAYYQMAQQLLGQETGIPCLESVQARFLMSLYLLGTSRMNQSWFSFGPAVQLLMAIGLHRKNASFSSIASKVVAAECSKRVLWCSFTLDQYLSLILGRPPLLREKDIDQDYPSLVNDEKLDTSQQGPRPSRNCLMDAPVFHMKLARILARASQDLYSVQPIGKDQELELIGGLLIRISQWQSDLPALLSDSICASSLTSAFQRQLNVIRLARYHAVMFVTRPLLLRDYSQEPICQTLRKSLLSCVVTARDTLELVLELANGKQLFTTFWYTQYVAFNALSVLYIFLSNSRKGRISHSWLLSDISETDDTAGSLIDLAQLDSLTNKAQFYLGEATEKNSLAWRYTTVLDALRSEAMGKQAQQMQTEMEFGTAAQLSNELNSSAPHPVVDSTESQPEAGFIQEPQPMDWETLQHSIICASIMDIQGPMNGYNGIGSLLPVAGDSDDFSLDFWPQLDRLPTCKVFCSTHGNDPRLIYEAALMNHPNN